MPSDLPIDELLPSIGHALQANSGLVVQAPPGAGKTTRIPPYLLRRGLLGHGQLVMVQPRRIAARSAAARIAEEGGWRLGEEAGYHVRFDRRAASDTRILAATEGILLRRLQRDPLLSDVSILVLDEFHERRLETDLLLGMALRIQQMLRPELRILVMSATLDAEPVARFLDCPVISSPGRAFAVRIQHAPALPRMAIAEQATQAVRRALENTEGDILVFLPGVGEIRQAQRSLAQSLSRERFDVMALYGDLAAEEQDRVLRPSDRRKVVLATNVAETSITIDGVRTVIDSGWARVMRYDAGSGLDRLSLEAISQASAEQRAGRAGRTAPGQCWRLWDEAVHRGRPAALEPEIQRVDLSGAALQLYAWGEGDVLAFPWLESPRPEAVAAAQRLLRLLGAVEEGRITQLGQQMAAIPAHPRIARLLLEGKRLGHGATAAYAAAILSERDILERDATASPANVIKGPSRSNRGSIHTRGTSHSNCDVTDRIEALLNFQFHSIPQSDIGQVRPASAQHVVRVRRQYLPFVADTGDPETGGAGPGGEPPQGDQRLAREAASAHSPEMEEVVQRCLLAAYPDRLARRRASNQPRGLMVGGKGVKLTSDSRVRQGELFLCLDVSGIDGGDARVRLASAIPLEMLPEELIEQREVLFFHPSQQHVASRRQRLWLDLVLDETPQTATSAAACAELLFQHASPQIAQVLPKKDHEIHQLIERIRWLAAAMPELKLPSMDEPQLRDVLRELCEGRRSFEELRQAPWTEAIQSRLGSQQWAALQRDAPARLATPKGARLKVTYQAGNPPLLEVKIQDAFGWRETPRVAQGRAKLLLHLLGPNGRCQQVTDDLASFWATAYAQLRKELKRRYPKHAWPENPHA